MFKFLLFALLPLASAFFNETTGAYNNDQAMIGVWLSAAAYCGKSDYETRTFKGPTTGFKVTYVMSDVGSDTQGYVGYLPSDKSIYVVYRGSSSIRNWITNLEVTKTAYTSFPECNCQVHKGFYNAEQKVFPGVLSAVKKLRSSYPNYAIKLTGHSLGAALAQLTAMDLVKNGFSVSMYNFGQPRVGDKAYASFVNSKVPTWRVTHDKDIVPHIPPSTGMSFQHSCTEEFENASHQMKTCSSSNCEDSTCSGQYDVKNTNVDDHLLYLNFPISDCGAVSR